MTLDLCTLLREMLVPLGASTDFGVSTDFKEQVRSRTDLVELIGEAVRLEPKRGGREFVGLCPFHDDHKPSLTVSPERQFYKCWSCGEGGDCFSFVMKTQALEFPAALRALAERAGIEVPRNYGGGGSAGGDRQKRLLAALEWAENEFHRFLVEGRLAGRARDYLAGRGFSVETVAKFKLGYHPDDWNWLLQRARNRFTEEELLGARLVRERKGGNGYYDDFVDRVLFPIRDPRGRTVAFGGRILPDCDRADAPKYVNSPESRLFAKSSLLYGFDQARESIRRSETAVVVEGYTDCITLHQHGLENVVGTLGTALTDAHVGLLKRFARKVVLVYDGDEAGRRAAERALAMFLAQRVDLRILTLPAGNDPAEFVEQAGADELRKQAERAPEAWEHKLQLSIEQHGLESIDGRDRVMQDMLDLMAVVSNLAGDPREDILLHRLSQRVGVGERKVRQLLRQARTNRSRRGPGPSGGESASGSPAKGQGNVTAVGQNRHERLECELLEIIFSDPETIETIRREIEPSELTHDRLRALLEVCFELAERGVQPTCERVTAELEDAELKRLAVQIDEEARNKNLAVKLRAGVESSGTANRPRFLEAAIQNIKWRRREASHQQSKGRLANRPPSDGDPGEDAKELLRRQTEYHLERATKKAIH